MTFAAIFIEGVTGIYDIPGNITVTAYQRGGDPTQLDEVFGKKSVDKYKYYSTKCNFKAPMVKHCLSVASLLNNYALVTFPLQFKDKNNHVPFDIGFATWTPISSIGLKQPKSLVKHDVEIARKHLT